MVMSMDDLKRRFLDITTRWDSLRELQRVLWNWTSALIVERDQKIEILEEKSRLMLELKLELREYKSVVRRAIDIGCMYQCSECGMLNQKHQRCLDCEHDHTAKEED